MPLYWQVGTRTDKWRANGVTNGVTRKSSPFPIWSRKRTDNEERCSRNCALARRATFAFAGVQLGGGGGNNCGDSTVSELLGETVDVHWTVSRLPHLTAAMIVSYLFCIPTQIDITTIQISSNSRETPLVGPRLA